MSERIKRDCQCRRAKHMHGTRTAYVIDKCRCDECREASRKEQSARTRLQAYGRYDSGRVDAEPVREHIKALGDYGIGLKRIAKMANVSNSTLGKIIYGDRTRNCAPRSRVERRVAEAVLAIKPDLKLLGNTVAVDGTGTRRRIQALITIGWSQSRLAARLGMTPGNFGKMFNSANVQAETARRVKDMYDELWNQPQIGTDQRSKISANRAMNYAKARGWVPPLAWDDETIDDPDATPSERGETNFIHAEDRMETIEFLLETGCGQGELVTRAGYKSLKALEKACYRQERNDLVYRVKRIREMERAA